jgi:hypothetical protein
MFAAQNPRRAEFEIYMSVHTETFSVPSARLQLKIPSCPSRPIMRVIKPTETDADRFVAESRLVAEMLCLEHGARAFGPDGQRLPEPHEPWPIVKLRPITATGVPSIIHYRPTVAVMYYTLSPGSSPRDLIGRLAAALERAGDAHLRGYRAVAATPSTVLRQKGRVIGGTVIVGTRKCVKKRNAEKSGYPARLLQLAPDDELPPHYSIGAGFTWVFMPITAALAIGAANFESMPAVNATLSAVYYDESQISTIPDGGDVARLTIGDFGAGDPPLFLSNAEALRMQAGRDHHEIVPFGGAVLIDLDGCLTFVGRLLNLHLKPGQGAWPPGRGLEELSTEAWAPETVLRLSARPGGANEMSRDFQCVNCAAPLGGAVAVIRAPRAPEFGRGIHYREWSYIPAAPNSLLLKGAEADIGVLLCAFCWDALESPACLTAHLGARVTRTVLPFTQAEAAAACPGYEPLAPLLAGRAAQLAGAEGAYVVTTPAEPQTDGASVILACEKLGRYPSITHPVIAATKLWVVTGVPLAVVRHRAA